MKFKDITLPNPNQSRIESYLGVIVGQEGAVIPEGIEPSRIELYLQYIIEHGTGGVPEAPIDGDPYVRKDADWEKLDDIPKDIPFEYLLPVGNIDNTYLAEVGYVNLDYKTANEYYENNITGFGGCFSIIKNGKLIRGYDWKYSNSCEFLVRTPAINGRHAVTGIVGQIDGLTKDFVKSGKYSDMYKILPFALTDGRNDMGLEASILVVPADKGNTTGTLSGGKKVNALMFIRYILDNYGSIDEVKQACSTDISIFVPQVMRDMGYEVHFLLHDSTMSSEEGVVLEFVNNHCVWKILIKQQISL